MVVAKRKPLKLSLDLDFHGTHSTGDSAGGLGRCSVKKVFGGVGLWE